MEAEAQAGKVGRRADRRADKRPRCWADYALETERV